MQGKLIKTDGKWFVDYIAEPAGDNNWHNRLPVYETEFIKEEIGDLMLVEKYNVPVCDLNKLTIEFTPFTKHIFEHTIEYAKLIKI